VATAAKRSAVNDDKVKRSKRRWRFVALTLVALFVLTYCVGYISDVVKESSPHIARIEISGVIEQDLDRDKRLAEIADDSHVKAVILHLNTPGGTVVGGESLYNSIKNIKSKKPVVAVMDDIATSAGYMVALPTDRIFAHNGTLTGSIGVLLQSAEFTDLAQKIGVHMDMIKSAPLKGSPSPFEKMTPAVRASMQSVINSFYTIFIDMVARDRKMNKAQVIELADGRVYTGVQAVNVRLVDAIGGEPEALDWLKKVKKIDESLAVRDIEMEPKPSKFQQILDELGLKSSLVPLQRISLQGLVAIW
jgi:protease-4